MAIRKMRDNIENFINKMIEEYTLFYDKKLSKTKYGLWKEFTSISKDTIEEKLRKLFLIKENDLF